MDENGSKNALVDRTERLSHYEQDQLHESIRIFEEDQHCQFSLVFSVTSFRDLNIIDKH